MHTFTHAISRTDISKDKKIVQILLYHIPKGEATSGAMLASRLSIYGTLGARAEVMNPVSQKFSTSKEEHEAKGNTERVQTITHDAKSRLDTRSHYEWSVSRVERWWLDGWVGPPPHFITHTMCTRGLKRHRSVFLFPFLCLFPSDSQNDTWLMGLFVSSGLHVGVLPTWGLC